MQTINVGAQKINSTALETYGIMLAVFSVTDLANKIMFFEKTFLVANVSPDMVLRMPFLTLNDADVNFQRESFNVDSI